MKNTYSMILGALLLSSGSAINASATVGEEINTGSPTRVECQSEGLGRKTIILFFNDETNTVSVEEGNSRTIYRQEDTPVGNILYVGTKAGRDSRLIVQGGMESGEREANLDGVDYWCRPAKEISSGL